MKTKLLYLLFFFAAASLYAQKIQIKGTVISSEDNFPIAGANVIVQGKNIGTTTDFDGNYEVSVDKGDSIVISYIGFTSSIILITNQTIINTTLNPDNQLLDEIVVVGYGTQKKKEVTGAVSVVDSKAIEKLNPVRIEQALQGQVAGVNVTTSSGSPGAASNIRIRGVSTNGDNNPLILVDGNRITDLSVINPNDIASVNVLKDATAGIYGVQAANGVILITTKSGRKNTELKFNIDSYIGFQETSNSIDVLKPRDYAILVNEMSTNGGGDPKYIVYPEDGTDWQEEVFTNAPILNINFDANGGTEKAAYSFGASYLDQDGIVGGDKSNYNRATARMNFQYDLLKNLKLSNTAIYTHSNKNNLNEGAAGSVLFNAINMNPVMSIYNPNEEDGFQKANNLGGEIINPVAQIANTYDTTQVNKISATLGIDYSFLEDRFKVSSKFQMNHAVVDGHVFKPEVYYGPSKSFNITTNEVYENKDYYDDYTWDNFITYSNTFNEDHSLTVLLGMSAFKTYGTFTGMSGTNLLIDGQQVNSIEYASVANAETQINRFTEEQLARSSNTFDTRLLSYFTRIQYNYKGKYLLSGVLRRDGSTRFGPENRFGYFPSGSLGWNISEEDFLMNNNFVNLLKLRVSYGIIGSDKIGDYRYLSTLSGEATYVRNDETDASELLQGLAEGALANPEIQWEKQKTFNFGIDTRLLGDRISITMDVFDKRTEDLLITSQVSGILGSTAPGSAPPTINAGTVQNKGFEFQIAYNSKFSEDFKINASYNFTTLDNEVLFVSGENGFEAGGGFGVGIGVDDAGRMEAGYPIGYFYGYKSDGVFASQEEIDNSPISTTATSPGDLKLVDINNDGEITTDDRTYIGDPIADVTMGFNLGLNYKNIDFSASAFASLGAEMVRDYERQILEANKGTYNLDRWTSTNASSNVPRLSTGGTPQSSYFSDFYVEDASFLRIQNVQAGYTFQEKTVSKIGLDRLRVYVSANNLFTFTNYKGYDAGASSEEPIGAGIDKGFYPVARTYMIGLNLKF